jgi:hypothetical protein
MRCRDGALEAPSLFHFKTAGEEALMREERPTGGDRRGERDYANVVKTTSFRDQ